MVHCRFSTRPLYRSCPGVVQQATARVCCPFSLCCSMFHLGLPDVLPVSDLGVRRGMAALYQLRELPTPAQMETVAEAWRPWRSVGSYYMWRVETPRGAGKKRSGK